MLPILFLSICTSAFSQFHQDIFPNLQGDNLRTSLEQTYKPFFVYPYSAARDTLWQEVWGKNDSLSCFYTGHTLYLNPALDPTDAVFMNGDNNGINTEHIYPQSKGASTGNARADMHHLAPVRVLVNSTRGSDPYDEINDTATDLWHFNSISTPVTPNQNVRDNYSESRSGAFEPRENVKGDVARAVFYFYTMYRVNAINADANYFDSMVDELCQWHLEDPADETEFERTVKISWRQENKVNPFVIDCTLAERMNYCNNACSPITSVIELSDQVLSDFNVSPNPFDQIIEVTFSLSEKTDVQLQLLDVTGKELLTLYNASTNAGTFKEVYELNSLTKNTTGIYLLKMTLTKDNQSSVITKKIIQTPN